MNRTDFANFMCSNLYEIFDGDFTNKEFIEAAIKTRDAFEKHVRNIYELVEEIPLFLYVDYLTGYEKEGDIVFEEFENITDKETILNLIIEKCNRKYNKK